MSASGRMARWRALAGAWWGAGPGKPGALRVSEDALGGAESAALQAAVTEALEAAGVPAAQMAVRRRGRLVWAADAGPGVGPDDRFVIASSTKPVTATLVVQLAEHGALDLDAPIAAWLPELPNAQRLTPRQLLSHRSGLREYARDPAIGGRFHGGAPEHPWRREEVLDAIGRLGAERAPGGRFAYRNSNYVVAAELAERAGGRGVEALLQGGVAGPLGLRGFSFAREVPGTRLAEPHGAVMGRVVPLLELTGGRIPTDAIGPVWGDGGVACSARELARFTEALLSGELVGRAWLRQMVPRVRRRRPDYGLGLTARRDGDAVAAGHDGMYFGWTASTSMADRTGTTVSVTCNLMGMRVPAARLARAARAALAS